MKGRGGGNMKYQLSENHSVEGGGKNVFCLAEMIAAQQQQQQAAVRERKQKEKWRKVREREKKREIHITLYI